MLLIENGTVITPLQTIHDGAVCVDRGRIVDVGPRHALPDRPEARRIDAAGSYIVPGFINMHIHGVAGYDVMDGRLESLQVMSQMLTQHGVTAWVPTTSSAPLPQLTAAVETVCRAREAALPGAEILGAHVEGPYLSPHERGAHPLDLLRLPDPEEYAGLLALAGSLRLFTLAPELPGALDLIRALKVRGVVVSAGHSVAVDAEVARAVEAGLSHATHLFCNMGTLRRVNLRRVAGMVESALLDDRITVEIIADGYHLAPSLMQLALKIKGPDRLAIVTDGSPLTGLPPGRYTFLGQEVVLEEAITYVADRSAYAGSAATMDHCLRYVLSALDLSLPAALRIVSLTPARILGVSERKGSLEVGKDADIAILDADLKVTHTVVRGQPYRQGNPL